jgi:hypothetical protein
MHRRDLLQILGEAQQEILGQDQNVVATLAQRPSPPNRRNW